MTEIRLRTIGMC